MSTKRIVYALAAMAALLLPAAANDSTAELGLGGLQLTRTDKIQLLSEDLYVSVREVRVVYRFVPHREPEVLIAVPIPDPAEDLTTSR